MPSNEPRPTKAQRRDDARAKALALKKEQERRAKRNRIVAISVIVVAVLALIGAGVYISNDKSSTAANYTNVVFGDGSDLFASGATVVPPALADVTAPSTANDKGAIPVSSEGVGKSHDGDVVVSIYFDLQCPYCEKFDTANATDLDEMVANGGVTIDYHPISFLDNGSLGTHYSNRAANAVAIVADKAPEKFTAFITALYADQPEEGTKGLTDDKIASIAQGVGVPSSVTDTFTDTVTGTFQTKDGKSQSGTWRLMAPWVAATTNQANTDLGGLGTPTVLIDGQEFKGDLYSAGPLTQAVQAAVAAKQG